MRLKLRSITFLLLIASPLFAAQEGAPKVSAFINNKIIHIGDTVRYVIEARTAKDIDVAFPMFKDNRLGDFEVRDYGAKTEKVFFGTKTSRQRYDITTYLTGTRIIPPVELKYKKKTAKDWSPVLTKEMSILVESVLPKGKTVSDIKGIKGPLYFREINWALVIIILTVISFAAGGIILYTRKRRRTPARLPHETALEELEAIKNFLSKTGDVKEYYVRISDCVRNYIERRFSFKAPEMTTEEFLDSLKNAPVLSSAQKDLLKEFLAACDLVKFAKYSPTREETGAVFSTAKDFIEETRP